LENKKKLPPPDSPGYEFQQDIPKDSEFVDSKEPLKYKENKETFKWFKKKER
jgi:hypothetical protein